MASRKLTISWIELSLKKVISPEQPPSPEHMMEHSGSLLQCGADQLWPSSWAVSATRLAKFVVHFDCDSPYASLTSQTWPRYAIPMIDPSRFLPVIRCATSRTTSSWLLFHQLLNWESRGDGTFVSYG